MVTHEELEQRAGGPFPLARPVAQRPTFELSRQPHARFSIGAEVQVRDMHPEGHTRVPRYVRGKRGRVLHIAPKFSFPDGAAHGMPPHREHTYHVVFSASELWPGAGSQDSVVVDLWDSYLEPV